MKSTNDTATTHAPVVPEKVSGVTSLQLFAALTVGLTTAGAGVAVWQLVTGQVGTLELVLLAVFYFTTALGIEVGFHRFFSHTAFKGPLATTWLLGILGSMAAQGPLLFWAATHRKHHAHTDKPGDLHSPYYQSTGKKASGRIAGLFHAHMGWLFAREQASWARYAPDLLRRRELITINSQYLLWVMVGLLLPAAIGGVLSSAWEGVWRGLIWGGLLRIFLLDHVTWSVNSLCHTLGSQPHKVTDNSRNVFLLCIPSVGGSFHNNHHAFPSGARNDHQSRWQLDLSGIFIESMGRLGLARNIRRYQADTGKIITERK